MFEGAISFGNLCYWKMSVESLQVTKQWALTGKTYTKNIGIKK